LAATNVLHFHLKSQTRWQQIAKAKDRLVIAVAKASKKKTTNKKPVKAEAKGRPLPNKKAKQANKGPAKKTSAGKVVAKKATKSAPTKSKSAPAKPASKKPSSAPSKHAPSRVDSSKPSTNGKSHSKAKPVVATKPTAKPSIVKPTSVKASVESKAKVAVDKSVGKLNGSTIPSKPITPIKATAKPTAPKKSKVPPKPPEPPTNPTVLKRIRELQQEKESNKDISFRPTLMKPPGANEPIWEKEPTKDRIALLVRDAFWLHATWDITRRAIERARAAMAEHWHTAQPTLRFLRLDNSGTTNTSETIERDIPIHGGLRNWYIDIGGQAAGFQALVGYLSHGGRFHTIAESNIVHTPGAASNDAVDQHWSDMGGDFEHIYAMSGGYDAEQDSSELKEMLEDRLHRPVGAPAFAQFGAGAEAPFRRRGGFHFEMDVELVAFGSTVPDGFLTLSGEPVKLRPDGTFVVRLPFPDRRQVLPAMATSRDGSHQRTIVIAVERNTKIMEPFAKEVDEGP
jgi:uncharacterized protein